MAESDSFAVSLREVDFRRQGRLILSGVDLDIRAGEKWVLFGPNGIGKSTLVSLMTSHHFPSSGSVDILGRRMGQVDVFALRRSIGLASRELVSLLPSGEDPLDVVLTAAKGVTGRRLEDYTAEQTARARSLLVRFGVGYLEGAQMWRLSEGELSRVLVARALMNDPQLLVLDEPTTGLDLGAREQVIATLGDIGEEDSTRAVVLVTHRLEEIPRGFDKIALVGRAPVTASQGGQLAPGTVLFQGPIEEGLTDRWLTRLFNLPLHVERSAGRWSAFARSIRSIRSMSEVPEMSEASEASETTAGPGTAAVASAARATA